MAFIDADRSAHGVESMCAVLPIAPSTYFVVKTQQRAPTMRCARAKRGARLDYTIQRVHDTHHRVYGSREAWRQLNSDGELVAHFSVERLMRRPDGRGVIPGKQPRTSASDATPHRPLDRVQRQCVAARPSRFWVAGFTYVATWRGVGYMAFVVDVLSSRTGGWCASASMRTDLALEAIEETLDDGNADARLVHHSDGESQ